MENLNTAFDVAEKHLDIPRMLDAEGTCVVMLFIYLFIQGVGLLVYFLGEKLLEMPMQLFIDVAKCLDFLISVLFSRYCHICRLSLCFRKLIESLCFNTNVYLVSSAKPDNRLILFLYMYGIMICIVLIIYCIIIL